jgi:hypothetical protein
MLGEEGKLNEFLGTQYLIIAFWGRWAKTGASGE